MSYVSTSVLSHILRHVTISHGHLKIGKWCSLIFWCDGLGILLQLRLVSGASRSPGWAMRCLSSGWTERPTMTCWIASGRMVASIGPWNSYSAWVTRVKSQLHGHRWWGGKSRCPRAVMVKSTLQYGCDVTWCNHMAICNRYDSMKTLYIFLYRFFIDGLFLVGSLLMSIFCTGNHQQAGRWHAKWVKWPLSASSKVQSTVLPTAFAMAALRRCFPKWGALVVAQSKKNSWHWATSSLNIFEREPSPSIVQDHFKTLGILLANICGWGLLPVLPVEEQKAFAWLRTISEPEEIDLWVSFANAVVLQRFMWKVHSWEFDAKPNVLMFWECSLQSAMVKITAELSWDFHRSCGRKSFVPEWTSLYMRQLPQEQSPKSFKGTSQASNLYSSSVQAVKTACSVPWNAFVWDPPVLTRAWTALHFGHGQGKWSFSLDMPRSWIPERQTYPTAKALHTDL